MSIKMATWLHGNGAQPEFEPRSKRRMAGSGLFGGLDLSTNWFHFPISTPVIINDARMRLSRAFVLYRMKFCAVQAVQLWSGGERVALFTPTQESGDIRHTPDVDRSTIIEDKSMFNIVPLHGSDPIQVQRGLSISVKVAFDSRQTVQNAEVARHIGTIEFFSAGADWE